MNFEKAKLIHSKFMSFLLCDSFSFIAPSDSQQLKSFLELAYNYPGEHTSLIGLLIDNDCVEKILKENFPDSDYEIYVASHNFTSKSTPIGFMKHIEMEELDFDVNRYM